MRAALFHRFSRYTEIIIKGGFVIYFLATLMYFVFPIYMYLAKGELVGMLPSYLPFVDENTTGGYVVLICYHLALMVFGCTGIAGSDFLFTMAIANTPIMSNLVGFEVELLNEELKHKENAPMINGRFRNILFMHREMTELSYLHYND